MRWELTADLICPQCLHHNALTTLVVGPRSNLTTVYSCRDCGYLYEPKASRCSGCHNPITKRCGLDCYKVQPAPPVVETKPKARTPSYRAAIEWLATNSGDFDIETSEDDIAATVIVGFTADMFGKTTQQVAADIRKSFRKLWARS